MNGKTINSKGLKIALVYMTNYKNWPFGGMLSYVKNILPSLSEMIYSRGDSLQLYGCSVYGADDDDRSFVSIMRVKTGVKIIPNSLRYGLAVAAKKRLFDDVDIVYSHTESATIALKLLNRKIRVVHHQHGLSYKGVKGLERFHNAERWLAQKLADEVLVVASEEATAVHGDEMGSPRKYHSIGSPIPFDRIRKLSTERGGLEKGVRFVYTGRLCSHKNLPIALKAFTIYHRAHPDSYFTIIGDGPDRQKLEKWVVDHVADDSIKFLGELDPDSTFENLASSNVLLFPSNGEGVSLSVLEALAAGLPVVCRDVVGLRDLIIDGTTGFISREESVDGFVEAMERAGRCYRSMKTDCVEFASRYEDSVIARQIVEHIIASKVGE